MTIMNVRIPGQYKLIHFAVVDKSVVCVGVGFLTCDEGAMTPEEFGLWLRTNGLELDNSLYSPAAVAWAKWIRGSEDDGEPCPGCDKGEACL